MAEFAIEMVDVNKWFGDFHVLKDINLKVGTGERVVICGPSGSGKSTVVRCVNRLEHHQKGVIRVNGAEVTDRPEDLGGDVGMVFQQFNLFPHLTVLDNITLAPRKVRKMPYLLVPYWRARWFTFTSVMRAPSMKASAGRNLCSSPYRRMSASTSRS